jgi:hypothetical protein
MMTMKKRARGMLPAMKVGETSQQLYYGNGAIFKTSSTLYGFFG